MNKIFIIVLVLCLGLVISLREHFIPQEQENFEGLKVLRNFNKKGISAVLKEAKKKGNFKG